MKRIELRHVDGAVAECVRAYFAGELTEFQLDGRRSVRIVHPSKEGVDIKIKGACFHGKGRAIESGDRR